MKNDSQRTFLIVAGLTLLFIVVAVVAAKGGPERTVTVENTPDTTLTVGPAPQSPTTTRTAAKPSFSQEEPAGCGSLDKESADALLDTMKKKGGTVELSASWIGEDVDDGRQEMAAIMVRSADGTVDQPHLVFEKVNGEWTAVTGATVEATDAPNRVADAVYTKGADHVVACLTAGAR